MRTLIALGVLLFAGQAVAQAPCAPREVIVQTLKEHGEELAYQGMSRSPNGPVVIEFFVSPMGGWTFVVTSPDGRSCLAAGGTDWAEVKKSPGI